MRERLSVGLSGACEKFHKEDLPCILALVLVREVYKTALIFALSVAAFAPLFSGCEKRIETANIDTVNRMQSAAEKSGRGLSAKEVESVLGQPTRVEKLTLTRSEKREFAAERHYYIQDGKETVLHFVEGRLSNDVNQFGHSEPQNPSEALAPNRGLEGSKPSKTERPKPAEQP